MSQLQNNLVHNLIVELGQSGAAALTGNVASEIPYGNEIWIGIHDRIEEGQFVFLSSNFTPPFMNFMTDKQRPEPNGGRGENCVDFFHNRQCIRGKWNDAPCSHQYQFLCEKPLIH